MVKSPWQPGSTAESAASPAMLLLYVAGASPGIDQAIIEQLHRVGSAKNVIPVAGASGAVAEIRKAKKGSPIALLLSPSLGDDEVAPLILEVKYEAKAVAVVGIGEARRAFRLVVAGADAVLVSANGVLVNADETLRSVALRAQPVVLREPAEGSDVQGLGSTRARMVTGLKKLSLLVSDRASEWWADDDPEMDNATPPEAPTSPEDLLLLRQRLDLALQARLRLEAQGPFPAALPTEPAETPAAAGAAATAAAPDVLKEWVPSWQRSASAPASDSDPAPARQAPVDDYAEIKAQLRRAIDAHRNDKLEWDATRHELEEALIAHQAAVAVGAELETVLNDTRKELAAARETHDADIEQWTKVRAVFEADREKLKEACVALDSQVKALRVSAMAASELQTTLATTQSELAQARDAHETERTKWNATQAALDAQVNALQSSATAASGLQVTLGAAQSELAKALETSRAEQQAWTATRQELEARVAALQTAMASKVDIETALGAARTELQRALESYRRDQLAWAVERKDFEAHRAEFETERQELEAQVAAQHGSSVVRLEAEAALTATRAELRRALDAQRAEQKAWETTRQELEARITAERSATSSLDYDEAISMLRAELRAALEAHRADELAWEGARLALGSRINDLEAELDSRSQFASRLDVAMSELGEAMQAQDPKRVEWIARRRQLEAALDTEAMTAASIDFEKAATQTLNELDRVANTWSMQAPATIALPIEHALGAARTGLQRALDAHAAEVAAWDMTRQHIEAELHEALLDVQGQRARLAAAHDALDTNAKTIAIDSVA